MPDKKRNDVPKPRPGFQGWLIGGLLALVIALTIFSNDSGMVTTTFRSFEKMVQSNDVQKVVLVKNQDFIEITLKPEALSNTKYKIELDQQQGLLKTNAGPHYKVEIVSIDKFVKDYEE